VSRNHWKVVSVLAFAVVAVFGCLGWYVSYWIDWGNMLEAIVMAIGKVSSYIIVILMIAAFFWCFKWAMEQSSERRIVGAPGWTDLIAIELVLGFLLALASACAQGFVE